MHGETSLRSQCAQDGQELLATSMDFLQESQPEAQRERGRLPEVAASSRLALLHNPADPGAQTQPSTQTLHVFPEPSHRRP